MADLPESEQIKHFYGVCWQGTHEMHMRAAQALGYKYLLFGHVGGKDAARPEARGLRFFLETPENQFLPPLPIELNPQELQDLRQRWPSLFDGYPRISQWFKDEWFDELKAYRPDVWQAYKEAYEQFFPWCNDTAEFPPQHRRRVDWLQPCRPHDARFPAEGSDRFPGQDRRRARP